jgi:thioredoxin-like negative regulator of GroEL
VKRHVRSRKTRWNAAGRALVAAIGVSILHAQQPVSRLRGRVVNDRGERIASAEVRAEGIYGPAAGTFAGQRIFKTQTNSKGEWNIMGISPGIWVFEAAADGYLPQAIAIPNRLLTASGPNAGGEVVVWQLVLEAIKTPDRSASMLRDAFEAARSGRADDAETLLTKIPEDADADYLTAAGHVALVARRSDLARALFTRALARDPSSYQATIGVASTFLLQRDFDSASRAYDAARNRTHNNDVKRFLSAAIGDLATIRVR